MNFRYTFPLGAMLLAFTLSAADRNIPSGYYDRLDGKSGAALKTAACEIIYPHTKLSYKSLWNYYPETDCYPGTDRVWDIYTDKVSYFGKQGSAVSGMNKEHSFPKSWWGGSNNSAYSDLFHLYPVNATANSLRGNWAYGEVDKTKSYSQGEDTKEKIHMYGYFGTPVSGQGGGSTKVFEPGDDYKGDLARTYFYMVTCYQDLHWEKLYHVENNTYPTLNAWSVEMLMRWHHDDPVSQKEIDRNEGVYKNQNNRNPFIDFPDLADYIWGSKVGQKFIVEDHLNGNAGGDEPENPDTPQPPVVDDTPTLVSPTQDFELYFGEVAVGHSGTADLFVKGKNLTEGKTLRLTVYDNAETDDAALFTIDGGYTANISASVANSSDGMIVRMAYKPTSVGTHESRLVISGGGIKGSIGIALKGDALPVPSLTAPTALEATDVTSTSYTANWTPAEGEEVDYYIVNRTKYIDGAAETERIETEDTQLEITDFCGSESYTVQSVRLDVESPESNSIIVSSFESSINSLGAANRFGVTAENGGALITCSKPISTLRVMEMSGRTVAVYNNVNNNDIIYLPNGIYIFQAAGAPAPIKVVIRTF